MSWLNDYLAGVRNVLDKLLLMVGAENLLIGLAVIPVTRSVRLRWLVCLPLAIGQRRKKLNTLLIIWMAFRMSSWEMSRK